MVSCQAEVVVKKENVFKKTKGTSKYVSKLPFPAFTHRSVRKGVELVCLYTLKTNHKPQCRAGLSQSCPVISPIHALFYNIIYLECWNQASQIPTVQEKCLHAETYLHNLNGNLSPESLSSILCFVLFVFYVRIVGTFIAFAPV